MADFNNAVMTNGGAALLAATTAGTAKIKFTKLVTGSRHLFRLGENQSQPAGPLYSQSAETRDPIL